MATFAGGSCTAVRRTEVWKQTNLYSYGLSFLICKTGTMMPNSRRDWITCLNAAPGTQAALSK